MADCFRSVLYRKMHKNVLMHKDKLKSWVPRLLYAVLYFPYQTGDLAHE